ncbi:MAG: ribosome biogenesis GTPase Der [Candidatus Aureabacteria bacterium]|nr:ribosome biogenesis GTPase Der [Candidatus Auribacterota bacterium]
MFKIAIIGRPNVGKSSLFNKIVGRRRSIVDAMPGVTRDRIEANISIKGKTAVLMDTGGFFEGTENIIEEKMKDQIQKTLSRANFVIFVCDAIEGPHVMDKTVHKIIKKSRKEYITVANKADNKNLENNIFEFYNMGVDNILPLSSLHNKGFSKLYDILAEIIPETENTISKNNNFRICIVGKPNAGKSSIINAILQQERVIVTDIPGTTRDEIDISYTYKDQTFIFTDTSGLRRKKKIQVAADQFGISRTEDSLSNTEMNILIIDGKNGLSAQDKRIAHLIFKSGKASLVVINKGDLIDAEEKKLIRQKIKEDLGSLKNATVITLSAKRRKNIKKLLESIYYLKNKLEKNIETAKLNKEIQALQEKTLSPLKNGRRLKIYYGVQKNKIPLEILLFINNKKYVTDNYMTYLRNGLTNKFDLHGIPLIFRYSAKKIEKTC